MEWVNRIGLLFDFLAFLFATPELLGTARLRSIEGWVEKTTLHIFELLTLTQFLGLGLLALLITESRNQPISPIPLEMSSIHSPAQLAMLVGAIAILTGASWRSALQIRIFRNTTSIGQFHTIAAAVIIVYTYIQVSRAEAWMLIPSLILSVLSILFTLTFIMMQPVRVFWWILASFGILCLVTPIWLVSSVELISEFSWGTAFAIASLTCWAANPIFLIIWEIANPLLRILSNDQNESIRQRALIVGFLFFMLGFLGQFISTF